MDTDRQAGLGGLGSPPGQQAVEGSLEPCPFPPTSYFWEATALLAGTWEQGRCAMSGFFHGVAPNRKETAPEAFLEPCLQAVQLQSQFCAGPPAVGSHWDVGPAVVVPPPLSL